MRKFWNPRNPITPKKIPRKTKRKTVLRKERAFPLRNCTLDGIFLIYDFEKVFARDLDHPGCYDRSQHRRIPSRSSLLKYSSILGKSSSKYIKENTGRDDNLPFFFHFLLSLLLPLQKLILPCHVSSIQRSRDIPTSCRNGFSRNDFASYCRLQGNFKQ